MLQPPTTASKTRFMPFPIQRPRPTGTSKRMAAASRCVVSLALIECSAFRLSSSCGFPVFKFPTKALAPVDESSRSEEHTSELQSPDHLVCRLLLEKKKKQTSVRLGPVAPYQNSHGKERA